MCGNCTHARGLAASYSYNSMVSSHSASTASNNQPSSYPVEPSTEMTQREGYAEESEQHQDGMETDGSPLLRGWFNPIDAQNWLCLGCRWVVNRHNAPFHLRNQHVYPYFHHVESGYACNSCPSVFMATQDTSGIQEAVFLATHADSHFQHIHRAIPSSRRRLLTATSPASMVVNVHGRLDIVHDGCSLAPHEGHLTHLDLLLPPDVNILPPSVILPAELRITDKHPPKRILLCTQGDKGICLPTSEFLSHDLSKRRRKVNRAQVTLQREHTPGGSQSIRISSKVTVKFQVLYCSCPTRRTPPTRPSQLLSSSEARQPSVAPWNGVQGPPGASPQGQAGVIGAPDSAGFYWHFSFSRLCLLFLLTLLCLVMLVMQQAAIGSARALLWKVGSSVLHQPRVPSATAALKHVSLFSTLVATHAVHDDSIQFTSVIVVGDRDVGKTWRFSPWLEPRAAAIGKNRVSISVQVVIDAMDELRVTLHKKRPLNDLDLALKAHEASLERLKVYEDRALQHRDERTVERGSFLFFSWTTRDVYTDHGERLAQEQLHQHLNRIRELETRIASIQLRHRRWAQDVIHRFDEADRYIRQRTVEDLIRQPENLWSFPGAGWRLPLAEGMRCFLATMDVHEWTALALEDHEHSFRSRWTPTFEVPTSGYWGLALGAAWDAETAHLGQLILDVRRSTNQSVHGTERNELVATRSGSPRSTTHPSLTSIIRVQEGDRLQGEISLHDQAPPHPNGESGTSKMHVFFTIIYLGDEV